jgi:hypothetical protein
MGMYRLYPERFAQAALGHNSKAVHRAYAKKAMVVIPTLEDYERKLAAASPQDLTRGLPSDKTAERILLTRELAIRYAQCQRISSYY